MQKSPLTRWPRHGHNHRFAVRPATQKQARFEGQGKVSSAGYPPANLPQWPGRQYTNLPFASQADLPFPLPIRNGLGYRARPLTQGTAHSVRFLIRGNGTLSWRLAERGCQILCVVVPRRAARPFALSFGASFHVAKGADVCSGSATGR